MTAEAAATESNDSDNEKKTDDENGGDDLDDDGITNINVGVLGHVDSGKTSLVKALSTHLSTASLDKSKQSRERGMTLDLGFSCFFMDVDVPNRTATTNKKKKKKLQITLVDCPGHASLIRTIIGGAQIIDYVVLVVDAVKGWQAQTTECLVLAELLLSNNDNNHCSTGDGGDKQQQRRQQRLIVALNKCDQFPEKEREAKIREAKRKVVERLKGTKFDTEAATGTATTEPIPIVPVAAKIGGEKVAAVGAEKGATATAAAAAAAAADQDSSSAASESYNMNELLDTIRTVLVASPPSRCRADLSPSTTSSPSIASKDAAVSKSKSKSNFYFAIDHCFALKGRGTVLTGTVLSGSVSVNDVIEFPTLATSKKIKSIQMFKRQVTDIGQGDRAAVCVSNLDPTLIERGMAAAPDVVQVYKYGAVALVRKVPYYVDQKLKCKTKFHISVGHATVMATVTFFGARELYEQQMQKKTISSDPSSSSLPIIPFDFNQSFVQQDELLESLQQKDGVDTDGDGAGISISISISDGKDGAPLLHWALLEFQTPVYCPRHSLIIGSRLDIMVDNSVSTAIGKGSTVTAAVDDSTVASTCRLAFSGRLIESVSEKDVKRLQIYTRKERRGVISRLGDPHKRFDDGKAVRYEVFGSDLFKAETNMKIFTGMKVEVERSSSVAGGRKGGGKNSNANDNVQKQEHQQLERDVGEIKSSFGTSGMFRVYFPAGTEAREGDALVMRFKRYAHDEDKVMHQDDIILPQARPGALIDVQPQKKKAGNKKKLPDGVKRVGEVTAIKGDPIEDGGDGSTADETKKKYPMAIVSGFFAPEINIKEQYVGTSVRVPAAKAEGTIAGPFGKAGKCKVSFQGGISADAVGSKAELKL